MGLRCSILGHEFGDAELQREREERGDEVVVTIREVRACERCGVEHVESESTEVRPVEPAGTSADADANAGGSADGAAGEGVDAAANAVPDAGAGTGGDADADTGFADGPASAGSGGVGTPTVEEAETPAPEDDDGIILGDDEEGSSERPEGEWPRADDTRLDEHDRPPEQTASTGAGTGTGTESGPAPGSDAGGDDPAGAETATGIPDADANGDGGTDPDENGDVDLSADAEGTESEDAEILGDAPGSASGPDAVSGNGEAGAQSDARSVTAGDDWPEHDDTPDEGFVAEDVDGSGIDAEFSGFASEADPETSTGDRSRAPAVADSVSLDAADGTVFVCGECGFSESIERSSLRAGDICPDCRADYLYEATPDEK
jgi:hypothetical protein